MTTTIRIGGQIVELDDRDIDRVMDRLLFTTRQYVWMPARLEFDTKYDRWRQHDHCHSINLFLWAMETLGGATIPRAGLANRLKRERDALNRLLNPRGLASFYQRFGSWHYLSRRFCRDMRTYLEAVQVGGGRTVRVLEITRDVSFTTLAALATLPTGGGALAVTSSATATVARGAAASFIVGELQNSATRLGRVLAGETVTASDTMADIVNSAINAVPDALMGEVVGHFMGPLTGNVGDLVEAEVEAGRLVAGQAMSFSEGQIHAVVQDQINRLIGNRPADIRQMLQSCPPTSSGQQCARVLAPGIMAHSGFRRGVAQQLERLQR